MKKFIMVILFVMALCGYAFAAPQSVTVQTDDAKKVKDMIVANMLSKGIELTDSSEYQLTFEKNVDGIGAFLFMNKASMRKPLTRAIFSISPASNGVMVAVIEYTVISPGSPYENIAERTEKNIKKEEREYLYGLKATIEGRTIEDVAMEYREDGPIRGVDYTSVEDSGIALDGNTIKSITDIGVAKKAGLLVGDIILEINGRPFDESSFKTVDERLASGRTVMILYERDGVQNMATLKAE